MSWKTSPGDDLGDDVRGEEEQPQDGPAGEVAVEQQRQSQREGDLDGQREDDDERVVRDRAEEDRVGQGALVVGQADEVGQRRQAVPLEEAVERGLGDGQQDEDHVEDERRQHEQGDRGPARSIGAPAARARRLGVAVTRCLQQASGRPHGRPARNVIVRGVTRSERPR